MNCPCGGVLESFTAVGAIAIPYVKCLECDALAHARQHPAGCFCAECDDELLAENFHGSDVVTCDWCYQVANTPQARQAHQCPEPEAVAPAPGTPDIVFFDRKSGVTLGATIKHKGKEYYLPLPCRYIGDGNDVCEAILKVLLARELKVTPHELDMLECHALLRGSYD